jgi:purine-binding chemotaxis protein CheW
LTSTIVLTNEIEEARSLTFLVAGKVYACDVDAVREVVPLGHVTRLPGAPSFVPGLINVRGVIVTVIDAGLYLYGRTCRAPGSIMLVDVGTRSVGVLVDTVVDVRAVRGDEGYERLDVRAIVARVIAITEEQ